MSITYRCDRCGHEHTVSGVVENTHKTHGFEEMSQPFGNVRDVCAACYKAICRAYAKAEIGQRKTVRQRVAEMLGLTP